MVLCPKLSIPWHDLEMVRTGEVVLQDKSSCFSALALVQGNRFHTTLESNSEGLGDFIDACAAPGNKTSHLAALISQEYDCLSSKKLENCTREPCDNTWSKNKSNDGNVKTHSAKSTIFAFDRSSSRIKILRDRMGQIIPSSNISTKDQTLKCPHVQVVPIECDFLTVDPNNTDYSNVRSILLDPSCSGSGIINSPDRFLDDIEKSRECSQRIESLSRFQLLMLKHAMSFTQVNRIVYSTCSVHKEENEEVVATALNEINEYFEDNNSKWHLVPPLALMEWHRRGTLDGTALREEDAKCLIRVDGMDGDETNSFFVAYFERKRVLRKDEIRVDSMVDSTKPMGLRFGLSVYSGEFKEDQLLYETREIDQKSLVETGQIIIPHDTKNGKKKRRSTKQ